LSRREIESHIPAVAGKVRVAHNGPNPRILPMERRASEGVVRSKLGLEPPFLLTVGTRWPRKNMNLAVEACERLPNTLPHRLAVTGKPGWGDVAPGLRAIATGFVSEELLSSLYSAADLYLAPSFHEGFGIPLLEAFVCGCPVLCSSGGALPEVAGGAAKIMPNWDPDDWAKAVADLLGDSSKLDSMRARGFERLKEFSWRRSAQVHAHVYREVAS
jgi:O-antigen biosynthesis alpha-1,3-rhamnosyltransferase